MTDATKLTVLGIVKVRLNRADTVLDNYLTERVNAAAAELERIGMSLTDSADDIMLLSDYTAWQYGNRDKPGSMPEWLRLMRRERWLRGRDQGES